MPEQEKHKVGVHIHVTANELAGESEAGHKLTSLEPGYRCERAGEEDALDGSERDEPLSKGRFAVACTRDPLECPLCLALGARDGLDGVKQALAFLRIPDVCLDQEGVRFRVDILHHDLEAVKRARFGDLDFTREPLDEVFVDEIVGGGEEGENVGDEVAFVGGETVCPLADVVGGINFLCGPEASFGLLVHFPYLLAWSRVVESME